MIGREGLCLQFVLTTIALDVSRDSPQFVELQLEKKSTLQEKEAQPPLSICVQLYYPSNAKGAAFAAPRIHPTFYPRQPVRS